MKHPSPCPHCGQPYYRARFSTCPQCGKPTHPPDCPDPLCILDIPDSTVCLNCPKKPKPHRGWGGKREGAGAPVANLNRLLHGRQSKLLKVAVEKLAADPELRAFLLLLARAATTGEIPQTTKHLITRALGDRPLGREAATIRLKRMREGVPDA